MRSPAAAAAATAQPPQPLLPRGKIPGATMFNFQEFGMLLMSIEGSGFISTLFI